MAVSLPSTIRGRWHPSARFLARTARRTIVESLYLFTAPVSAAAGLMLVLGGLLVGAIGLVLPGRSLIVAGGAVVRWAADLERWRIAKVRLLTTGTRQPDRLPRPTETAPGLWLDAAHAVTVVPVVIVTSILAGLWWLVGVACVTFPLRSTSSPQRPMTLYAGAARLSLELASSAWHLAFAITLGLLLLCTLPLVTRTCVAIQAGLGQTLLTEVSALYRRIAGLEQERDTARAQTVAAVTAEAAALRRLERDLHDGPQQRLVRLAIELGRAQRHLDSRPEAAREALADAIVQAQEALEELRALSRGIAPPILTDRGLRDALATLAARSVVPAEFDAAPLGQRLDAAVETAAYFVVAEALTNVAKHSQAERCAIGMRLAEGTLRVRVTDDGVGGAARAKGHGLAGLEDRLHAVGGRLLVASPDGGPTTVTAELPCR
jgi:signal transduction histidine kinase